MEAFEAENGNAMSTDNLFSGIAKTLRVLELCLAVLFLSWIFTRLPFAVRIFADFLRSPLFVFALSNAIIAALLAHSGLQFSATDDGCATTDHISISSPSETDNAAPVEQITDTCTDQMDDSGAVTDPGFRKAYRRSPRSQPERMKPDGEYWDEKARVKLRRSETEKARENLYPEDKLSNEEFQRTIEAFIAKHMRFLREEEESC